MILTCEQSCKQTTENSNFDMREKIFKQPMESLDLKRHKYKARDTKVFEKAVREYLPT